MFNWRYLLKYLIEGGAVALVSYVIPLRLLNIKEIAIIGITAAAIFAVLDFYAPAIAVGARHGTGFKIGSNLVSMSGGGDCDNCECKSVPIDTDDVASVSSQQTEDKQTTGNQEITEDTNQVQNMESIFSQGNIATAVPTTATTPTDITGQEPEGFASF